MDVNTLLKALDNDKNEQILDFTTKQLREEILQILKELSLSKKETKEIFDKLKDYKYIKDINDLKSGAFIRWIPIDEPDNIYLTKGAIFCNFCNSNISNCNLNKTEGYISDDETPNILYCICKNIGFNSKHFRIEVEKNLIFKKLTQQEKVLLIALEQLI